MEPRQFTRGYVLLNPPINTAANMLQRNRDHSVADAPDEDRRVTLFHPASMEPRPFNLGDVGAARLLGLQWLRFNGAATIQSRRRQGGRGCDHLRHASMEPRPFSRGDHNVLHRYVRCVLASMEPRPFSRGDSLYDSTTVTDFSGAECLTRTLTCAGKLWFAWRSFQPLTGSILPSKLRALPIWQMHHRTARIPTPFPIAPHRRHYHITVRPPSPPVPPASAACPTYSASQSPAHVLDRCLLSVPCPP